jgi:hypothetical protein
LYFCEAAAELVAKATTAEPAGLESSVEDAEHVCQEVQNLLAKVQSMLDRVQDISAPESTRTTLTGVFKALALREDGEDPLITAVRRAVTTGSEFVFSMMMMHGVDCDFDKVTGTYPKGKDGRDISRKEFLERARALSEHMANFLAERNAEKKAARERRRSAKGASSGRAETFAVVMDNVLQTSVCHDLVNPFAA